MSTSATATGATHAPAEATDQRGVERPHEGKGERTRQAVLEAAIAHFAAVGFRGASVPAIARDVRVSPSAVYAYFSSKTELFEEAVDADVAGLISDALPEVLAGRFDRDFPGVFRRLLASLDQHPLARRVIDGQEGTGAERLAVLPAEVQVQRGLAQALRKGQADGTVRLDIDPELMAAGLEAVVIALLIALLQTGGLADSSQARGAIAVLEASIRPPTP